MTVWVRQSGTWKQVTKPWVRHANTAGWVPARGVWVRHDGTWKKVWPTSDPATWTWPATFTQTYRADGPKVTPDIVSGLDAASDLMQGFWENMPPIGGGFVTSLAGFDHADIRAKLAVRPVITKVRVRLAVKLDYGNQGTRARIATHNHGTEPATFSYTGYHDGNVYTDATKRPEGTAVWHTLPDTVGNQLRDNIIKGVGLYEYGRSTSEANKVEYRGAWYGEAASTALEPVLEITADYV